MKKLKGFKSRVVIPKPVQEPEVVEEEIDIAPTVIMNAVQPVEGMKIVDHLTKAGYPEIADQLKELQVTEGVPALDKFCKRLLSIEKHIDDFLEVDGLLPTKTLTRLLSLIKETYTIRARALLLPYGTVSPRGLGRGKSNGGIQVAVGIGNGLVPRQK